MIVRATIMICCFGLLAAECQNGWLRFDNSCYLFSHLKLDFADAEQFCNQHNGRLVHIETKRENDLLRSYCINELHVARRWIGMSDQVTDGRWVWLGTDTDITFNDWILNEPNQGSAANCGVFWESHEYHWADDPCDLLYEPICESELNPDVEIVG